MKWSGNVNARPENDGREDKQQGFQDEISS